MQRKTDTEFTITLRLVRLLAVVTILASAGAMVSQAATLGQGASGITSPQPLSVVRGRVPISGIATHPNFWKYEVHYAPEPNPGNQWFLIGVHEQPVIDGVLDVWDTTVIPDGTYSLRLRVVRRDGNYDEYFVRQLLVANQLPTETPTPATPPTPTATPTPLPTPTPVKVEQPSIPTPTPAPSPSPTPAIGPTGEEGQGGVLGALGLPGLSDALSPRALLAAFLVGAKYAAVVMIAVGAFFAFKTVLMWLWSQIRH